MTANVIKINNNRLYPFEKGKVLSVHKEYFEVAVNNISIHAQKAFGCLIEPIEGDIVILADPDNQGFYILNVLEREKEKSLNINFDSDIMIKNKKGSITLASEENLNMISKNHNTISENSFEKTERSTIKAGDINISSKTANLSIGALTIVSDIINSIAKNVIGRFVSYMRKTETSDMIEASTMDRKSKGLYSLNSEYSIMVSKKDTKIDGEHIHMG